MAATDVSFDDQQKINAFSRLNTKLHDLQARITAKQAAAEDLEEAGNEVMLLDDETVPFVVGECMVHLPRDDVEERLQKLQDEAGEEVKRLQGEVGEIQSQMAELKATLYAKFGNAINLEE